MSVDVLILNDCCDCSKVFKATEWSLKEFVDPMKSRQKYSKFSGSKKMNEEYR